MTKDCEELNQPPAALLHSGEPASEAGFRWKDNIEGEYRKIKEHVETYPYQWASFILVYGSLSAYLAVRWRKLRRTEDRVRVLHRRLRQLVEAEETAAGASGQKHTAPISSLTHPRPKVEKSKFLSS